MSVIKADSIDEHTTGQGVEMLNPLYGPGYMMQPDKLEINMTIPVGNTLYVRDAMIVDGDNILTVDGTLVVI